MAEATVGKRPWREKVCPAWLLLVLAMGLVWRRRWWRFLIGGLNRPLIFLALFAWNLKYTSGGTRYLDFLLPGLVVMAAVTASYTDLVNWFTLRRTFYRVLDEYLPAPVPTGSLLAGHVLAGGGKGLLTALAVCLVGWAVVGELRFSALFLVQLAVICLLFASLAVAVAMIAGGDRDVLMFTNLVVFPMTFFCGTFFPVERLPGALAQASWFLPLTAATYNLRALALTGTPPLGLVRAEPRLAGRFLYPGLPAFKPEAAGLMRELLPDWYPIVWEEMVYWRRKFWLYLATYTLSPVMFLLTFGFGVGQRLKMLMPGGMSYLEFLVPGVVRWTPLSRHIFDQV